MFNDDIVLINNSEKKFQSLLERAFQWSNDKSITVSISISKIYYSGVRNFIKTNDSWKYLGVMIDERVNYKIFEHNMAQELLDL